DSHAVHHGAPLQPARRTERRAAISASVTFIRCASGAAPEIVRPGVDVVSIQGDAGGVLDRYLVRACAAARKNEIEIAGRRQARLYLSSEGHVTAHGRDDGVVLRDEELFIIENANGGVVSCGVMDDGLDNGISR